MGFFRIGSAALCATLLASGLATTAARPQAQSAKVQTTRDVRGFLEHVNQELLRLSNAESRAAWIQATYITPDTNVMAAEANEAYFRAVTESRFTEQIPYLVYFDGSVRGLGGGAEGEVPGVWVRSVANIAP